MAKTKVDFSCKIKLITAGGKTLEDNYTGGFQLDADFDSDFGGEDVFLMPEVLREVMYHLDEMQNGKAGLKDSKLLDFSITEYKVETVEGEP